jgi:hypothetical protein
MQLNRTLLVATVALIGGFADQAIAGALTLTGSYTYGYTGPGGTDTTCPAEGAPPTQTRDDFSGTGSNSDTNITDIITFSACNLTPGAIVGGEFEINDGAAGDVQGTFSAINIAPVTINGFVYELDEGTYTVTSATDDYSAELGGTGGFTAETGPLFPVDGGALQGTGFLLLGTPEPASMALFAGGILAIGFAKRRRKSQPLA